MRMQPIMRFRLRFLKQNNTSNGTAVKGASGEELLLQLYLYEFRDSFLPVIVDHDGSEGF